MNGVDNMLYMQSTNANDGTAQLTVTFGVETTSAWTRWCRTAWRRRSPTCRQMSSSTGSRHGSPPACPCSSFPSFRPTTRTMRSFSPTTPPLTSTTSSTACRVWARCGCSGPAITPCASGSSRMCWPRARRAGPRQRDPAAEHRQPLRPGGRGAGARGIEKTYTVRAQGRLQTPEGLAASSSAPTRTAPSCACRTWPGSNWAPSTISSGRAERAARCRHRDLSVRLQCAGHRERGQTRARGPSGSPPTSITRSRSTRRCR